MIENKNSNSNDFWGAVDAFEDSIVSPGEYVFTITDVNTGSFPGSKSGTIPPCKTIEVTLSLVSTEDPTCRKTYTDTFFKSTVKAAVWKMKQLLDSVGGIDKLLDAQGNHDPNKLIGLQGICEFIRQEKAGRNGNTSFYTNSRYYPHMAWIEIQRKIVREQREQEDALNAFGATLIGKNEDTE